MVGLDHIPLDAGLFWYRYLQIDEAHLPSMQEIKLKAPAVFDDSCHLQLSKDFYAFVKLATSTAIPGPIVVEI